MGFSFTALDDGRQALDTFADEARASGVDFVIMNSNMPVMGGIEATAHLRARGVAAPIIAVTADAMADEIQRCLDAGMDDYISKPVDLERLAEVLLRSVLDERD